MDRLSGLTAFVRTADLGSFVAAGRVLGLSASAVGKAVTTLERELGVRLLQRSTRSIRLTEEGRLFHERCRRILDDLDDAEASLADAVATPRGRLRVSVPIVSYHLLLPVLPAFCAAPSYLREHGRPECPRDLEGHHAVRFRFPNSRKLQEWPITLPPEGKEPRLKTVLNCNNMEALGGAVLSGLGIGCLPDFLARHHLRDGRLHTVLDAHLDAPGQFHLLWPSNRHLSPKVRVFVDFLSERLFADRCENVPAIQAAQ